MTEGRSADGQPDAVVSAAAVGDGGYTLLVADFSDTSTAWEAYEMLRAAEDGRHLKIEGALVVNRDADGKLDVQTSTDHSTKRGLTWGLVGGVALGLIFPPTILGSAAVLGGVGAAVGKGRQLHHRSELGDELEAVILPGHSGILALVSDPGVIEIRNALRLANSVVESAVDHVVAKDIKAAAKQVENADTTDT